MDMECQKASNALSGLVAQYDSDEEPSSTADIGKGVESFFKEIDALDFEKLNSREVQNKKANRDKQEWTECLDSSTGYKYYWNVQTNEVSWILPPKMSPEDFRAKRSKVEITPADKCLRSNHVKGNDSICVVADCISSPKKSFEELIKDIENERPPDYREKSPIISNISSDKNVKSDDKQVSTGIMLLSNYGGIDSEDENSDDTTNSVISTINSPVISKCESSVHQDHLKDEILTESDDASVIIPPPIRIVKEPSESKPKLEVKSRPMDFISFVKGDTMVLSETTAKKCEEPKTQNDLTPPTVNLESHDNCSSTSDYVSKLLLQSEEIVGKLEFLCNEVTDIQPFKILHIEAMALTQAWQAKALKDSYYNDWLEMCDSSISTHEKDAVPEGWSCHWDRKHKRYFYCNKSLGLSQWSFPVEEENEETCDDYSGVAPPPPPMSDDTNSDMEAETTDEEKKDIISQELTTFYEDLANMDDFPVKAEMPPEETMTTEDNIPKAEGRKKKKTKLSSGLGLKKKGVPDLVAKWQKVQKQLSK